MTRLTLAISAISLAGCGGAQPAADLPAQDKMADADVALVQNQLATAQADSDAAANMPDLSPAVAVQAHTLQGQVRVASANQLLSQAQNVDLNVTRLLGEVRIATAEARSAQAQIQSDQAYDPSAAQDQLRTKIAQAQGSPGSGEIWPGPNLPAPDQSSTPVDVSSIAATPAPPATPAPAASQPQPAAPASTPAASAPTAPATTGGGGGGFFASLFGGGAKQTTAAPAQTTAPAETTPPAPAPEVVPPVVKAQPIRPEDLLTLHTVAGLDALVADAQSKLQANRTQAQSLTGQRTSLLEQADQLQQKSISDPGADSVNDVKTAAGLRRQAAEVAIQIDQLNATAAQLQSDLRTTQGQRAGVQQAIDAYTHEIADLDLAWQSVKQDIDAQKTAVAAIAGPGAAAPASAPAAGDQTNMPALPPQPTTIADQCTLLKALIAQSRDLRTQAADQLKQAITDFNNAAKAGDDLRRGLVDRISADRTAPNEKDSLQQLVEATNAVSARLAAAEAQRALALNYSSETLIAIQAHQALTAAQDALDGQAPAAIADCLQSIASPSVADLTVLARERFEDALPLFDALTSQTSSGPAPQMRKTAALEGKMLTAFGARQLSLALSNIPIGGQTPQELQATIDDLAKQISLQDSSMLPAIPYTIAPDAAPAAPAAQ